MEIWINPSKAQAMWCTFNNKGVGQAVPVVSFNGDVMEHMCNLRYRPCYPVWQDAHIQDAGQVKTQGQKRTVCSVPAVSECDTQHYWLWSMVWECCCSVFIFFMNFQLASKLYSVTYCDCPVDSFQTFWPIKFTLFLNFQFQSIVRFMLYTNSKRYDNGKSEWHLSDGISK